jgi:hypothetical protein
VKVDNRFLDLLGSAHGEFDGTIRADVLSTVDGRVHYSPALGVRLSFRPDLTPTLSLITESGPLYVNDWIDVRGENFLLGGDEGTTIAHLDGCFRQEDGECVPTGEHDVPVTTIERFDRTQARFAFGPDIAGIRSGTFEGTVVLRNQHAGGNMRPSQSKAVSYDLNEAQIFTLGPSTVTVGQFVQLSGAGFVHTAEGAATLLQLEGQFEAPGTRPVELDILLVPEVLEGRKARYTINEDDALGQLLDMRYARGTFSGQVTPIVKHEQDSVTGTPATFSIELAPVKQVIYLKFTDQYVSALRSFGLQAVEPEIRQRVLTVVERDFRTINVEFRTEEPTDYSLYSVVELGGSDPNGLGLLGYDNTPGKDAGNVRLHDHIGGVNATTQADGYPGYGGVFIESLFIFSRHPGAFAPKTQAGLAQFDELFDPFRPDRDGHPVRAADLATGVPVAVSGTGCPSKDRRTQISCAIWTLGNLVGSTLSHEIGHSLGLANPAGGNAHHLTDGTNRLMDAGANRPFAERAELDGQGPSRFCREAYDYLRQILPTDAPEELSNRPSCL